MAPISRFVVGVLPMLAVLAACDTLPPSTAAPPPAPPVVSNVPVVTSVPVVTNVPVLTGALGYPVVAAAPVGSGATIAPGTVVAPVVVAPGRLTASEVLALMTDNTASGIADNGQAYYAYFHRDGRHRFRQSDWHDSGSWRVTSDGRLCTQLERLSAGVEQCYYLYRDANGAISFERDGRRVGSFTLMRGNPQNL